jgi:hypothetical protein
LNKFTFSFLVLLLLTGSCENTRFNNSETVLARVNDTYLYASNLAGLVPEGVSTADSLAICRNYVDNWVKNQLLLSHAEKNLTDAQKDFSRQLEDYRNSLIIYKYETELIRQSLDTVISDEEIEGYYEANQQNYRLSDNIVQVVFASVDAESPNRKRIKSLVMSDLQEDRDSLEFYCLRYAVDYEIADENWIVFNDFLTRVPIKTVNPEAYLSNNKFVELKTEHEVYYIHFLDYMLTDSISPLTLEQNNIKSIILNMRKKKLIKAMKQEIQQQALKDNDFEYY